MTKGIEKGLGQGECQYQFCNLPGKRFKKNTRDQKFCCGPHRTAQWNLDNPRTKEARDAKNQEPLSLGLSQSESRPLNVKTIIEERKKVQGPIGIKADKYFVQLPVGAGKIGKRWHYPNWKTNERLKKTLELLRKCHPTNCEIMEYTGTTRPKDDCIELRAQGFDITPVYAGKSEDGKRRINRWVLKEGKDGTKNNTQVQ